MAGRRAFEWHAPRNHFVKHDADAPNIGARIDLFAARLFGRHVIHGAHDDTRARLHARGYFAVRYLVGSVGRL